LRVVGADFDANPDANSRSLAFYESVHCRRRLTLHIGQHMTVGAELDEILGVRYAFLREKEKRPQLMAIGASSITLEYDAVYRKRKENKYRTSTSRLQSTFVIVFALVTLVLGILTFAHTTPFLRETLPWLDDWVRQFLRPILSAPAIRPQGANRSHLALLTSS
jgi:hypothetical protein